MFSEVYIPFVLLILDDAWEGAHSRDMWWRKVTPVHREARESQGRGLEQATAKSGPLVVCALLADLILSMFPQLQLYHHIMSVSLDYSIEESKALWSSCVSGSLV